MARKKIELTKEQAELYIELKKLSKRANQRLVRLERLTGEKGLFASKTLYDYLESVGGLSEKGRVKVAKSFTESQMIAIIKATKNFLEGTKNSVTGELKKQKEAIEENLGKEISWSAFSTMYTASELYKWAEDEFGSSFWKDFAPLVASYSKTEWVDLCAMYLDKVNDVTVKDKLQVLYDYLKE